MGSEKRSMRQHQREFKEAIDGVIAGSGTKEVLVHVTPGGGKSALPIIAGRLITAGLADAICWVVPRKSLQDQGERNFIDPFFRNMLGHSLTIRSSTNEINPCRGLHGFATTYQAIGMDEKQTVLRDFSTKRYILILDEFHHVEEDGEWFNAMAPIARKAAFLILMTGTLERGDKKPIAWVKYENSKPVLDANSIRYDRETALKERAILPIEFTLFDGHVEWKTKSSGHKSGLLSERTLDAGEALVTALSTGFSDMLLAKGVQHWKETLHQHPGSKLLIVTADFDHAKKATKRLKEQGLYVKIATSHDSPRALRNINEFKFGRLDILVSIAMAYEGLDAPQINHIVFLTRIRSRPWVEQCIARAVRIDRHAGPYNTQRAYIFAPDDFLFRNVVEEIESEQLSVIMKAQEERGERRENGTGAIREPDVIPLGSILTAERSFSLGGENHGASPYQTPTDLEHDLRHDIEEHVRDFCFKNYYRIERINAEIKDAFGKPRAEMTLSELRNTLVFIRDAYPLNGNSIISQVSQPRGKGRRKSAKAEEVEPPDQLELFGATPYHP